MALSEELKRIYASNPTDNRYFDTLQISHPAFTKTYNFVLDNISHNWKNIDDIITEFTPMNFSVVLPQKSDTQQEIKIQIDNTNLQLVKELNLALSQIKEPIRLISSIYTENEEEPQGEVFDLQMKNITINYTSLTASASAADTVNISYPKESFDQRFTGLYL